jgi:hypothetical protein
MTDTINAILEMKSILLSMINTYVASREFIRRMNPVSPLTLIEYPHHYEAVRLKTLQQIQKFPRKPRSITYTRKKEEEEKHFSYTH